MFEPFADASNPDFYKRLISDLNHALALETNEVARLATTAAWIFSALDRINWCGFYLFDGIDLVVGPYNGRPACLRIKPGRGVCGTAFQSKRTVMVPDVHLFPGHIACDAASRSEIVIPLFRADGSCYGVLDIDSPEVQRFSENDHEHLLKLLRVVKLTHQR